MKLKFLLRRLPERTGQRSFNYAHGQAIILKPGILLDHHTPDSIYFTETDRVELNLKRWSIYILKKLDK